MKASVSVERIAVLCVKLASYLGFVRFALDGECTVVDPGFVDPFSLLVFVDSRVSALAEAVALAPTWAERFPPVPSPASPPSSGSASSGGGSVSVESRLVA